MSNVVAFSAKRQIALVEMNEKVYNCLEEILDIVRKQHPELKLTNCKWELDLAWESKGKKLIIKKR